MAEHGVLRTFGMAGYWKWLAGMGPQWISALGRILGRYGPRPLSWLTRPDDDEERLLRISWADYHPVEEDFTPPWEDAYQGEDAV